MKAIRVLFLATTFWLGLWPSICSAQNLFQLSVSPIFTNGRAVLQFTMKNVSDSDITIRKADLPWGQRNFSLHVDAFVRKDGFELEHVSVFDVPEPGEIIVHRGDAITGSADLSDHLKSVKRFLEDEDLIVFWFYRAQTPDGKDLGEYGNWLVFPQITKSK